MKCILFVIIGAGLGHITRGLAVARQIRTLDQKCRILFFTTSKATELIRQYGFMEFHIPSPDELPGDMKAPQYNRWIGTVLNEIIDQNQVDGLIFEGAFPYQSITSIMTHRIELFKVWLKREGDRREYDTSSLNCYKKLFNLILLPGELGDTSSGSIDESDKTRMTSLYCERRVSPIMLLQYEEAMERKAMRESLGIDEEDIVWYVQLRDSVRGQENLRNAVIPELAGRKHTTVLVAQTKEEPQVTWGSSVIGLPQYPSSCYFKGVDYGLTAAGYNTVHELAYFRIPAILVPDRTVVKDDQTARARRIETIGGACILSDYATISYAVKILTDREKLMRKNLEHCELTNGAAEAAQLILEQTGRF